jgi:hypothetical protein
MENLQLNLRSLEDDRKQMLRQYHQTEISRAKYITFCSSSNFGVVLISCALLCCAVLWCRALEREVKLRESLQAQIQSMNESVSNGSGNAPATPPTYAFQPPQVYFGLRSFIRS